MNVASSTMPGRTVWLPRIGWAFMFVGALFAAGNAILFMTVDGFGGPDLKTRFLGEPLIGWAHTMGGAVAVLIGPFQFLSVVRNRFRRVHVWMGRVYLTAVLAGGLAGLYFAPTSLGGPITAIGFTLLAIIWLYTGSMAYLAIRRRDIAAHRRWMIRNYALTFAAVTLRIELCCAHRRRRSFRVQDSRMEQLAAESVDRRRLDPARAQGCR